jgi:hypothetical protein
VVLTCRLERRVEPRHLGSGEEVFPAAGADGDDIAAGHGKPQEFDYGLGEARCAVLGRWGQQDHHDAGPGGDLMHDLDVLDLLKTSKVRRRLARHGGHHPQPGRGNVVQAVEPREVQADVADIGRRRWWLVRYLRHHNRLAATVDPAIEQRLDAVGGAEWPRGIAGRRVLEAACADRPGKRRSGRCAAGANAVLRWIGRVCERPPSRCSAVVMADPR